MALPTDDPSDLEIVLEAIRLEMNDPDVWWGLYRTALSENTQLRRVVWIPTEFENEPVKLTNPLRDEDGSHAEILTTDEITLEAHITGKSFGDMCRIRVQVLQAVRLVLGPDAELFGGEYRTQQEQIEGVMWAGAEKLIQRFRFCLNVEKYPREPLLVVESIEQSVQLDDTTEGSFTLDETIEAQRK